MLIESTAFGYQFRVSSYVDNPDASGFDLPMMSSDGINQ
jgi:hypothetical protein